MLSLLGSSQVRVTESWVAVASRPLGLSGGSEACSSSGARAAGVSMWTQRERLLTPCWLTALIR